MKKNEVQIGGTYTAKISGKLTEVRILEPCLKGWIARNTRTGRTCHIRTAAKLRGPATPLNDLANA